MNQDSILNITKHALMTTTIISGPILVSVLIVGLTVAMFQAMTQINEVTLTFIPKLIVVGLILLIGGNWILNLLTHFSIELIEDIPSIIGIR